MLHSFLLGVGLLAAKGLGAFHKFHVHWDFHFEHIHAVFVFGKLRHGRSDYPRLLFGEVQPFFVRAFFIADEFQEEGDIVGAAFVANALDPGVFFVIDGRAVRRRVIEQDFHAVRACCF